MKKGSKNIIGYMGILLLYTLVGIIGTYIPLIYTLFPLLGIPLTLWSYKKNTGWMWIGSIIIPVLVSLLGHPTSSAFLFLMLGIPSVISGLQIREKDSIPQVLFITGLVYFAGFFLFSFYLKQIQGIHVPTLYYSYVENWQVWFLGLLEEQQKLLQSSTGGTLNQEVLFQSYGIMRMAAKEAAYLLQNLFPSILLVLCMVGALIQVVLGGLIIQGMGWEEIHFASLTQMGVTPIIPILLLCTWLLAATTNLENYWILETALSNVLFVFSILFFYLGVLLVIHIIRASKINMVFRILIGFFSFVWFFLSPSFFVFLGFFDGLFNLRKTKQVF